MTSVFKDFIHHFSLPWKSQHESPDCSWLFTGCTFFAGGCFLGAVCLIFGASWIFALLYFLLGILGCMICCFCGFTVFSIHNTEKLPLVSSKSKKLECKTLLKKTSSNNCNNFNLDTKGKEKNSEAIDSSLKPGISCGYDYLLTQINIDKNGEKVTCVDFNSNRCPGVCHEQYATGPAPRRRNNQTTKDDRQPQARGTLSFVRKMFKLPSVFKRKTSNPTPQHEIPLREFHRSISEEETFPDVEQSESVSAEEVEEARIQIKQSTSEDFLQRTYENLLPSKGRMPKIPQARDSNSGIRQDNTSDIQRSFDIFSPYQNVPLQEQRWIDGTLPKLVISSPHAEKGVPFSPEKLYENIRITRDPPRTYRHYENLSLVRPGQYATVHPGGRYSNIPTACHKSRQSMLVPHTLSSSAYQDPSEKDRYSMKPDRKSLLSSAAATEKNMTSAVQLANQTENIGEIRNPSKDSFHELDVSSPYVNIPSPRWQMTNNQQFQEARENVETFWGFEQYSAPNTEIYQSVPEKLSPANINRTVKDRLPNTPSGAQQFMPLGSGRPCVNISPPLESAKEHTSICDTSTRLNPVSPSQTQKNYEVEEKILPEKPYERSDISPLQGLCKTEKDKIVFQSDEKESSPLASEKTCFNNPPLQDSKNQCIQIPEAASEGQDTKQWKSKKPSKLLGHEVSPRKSNEREDMALQPLEKDYQTEDNNNKTLTEHSNVLYSEILADNLHLTRNPERKVSDVQNPVAFLDYKSPPKSERYSVKTRSDTDRMKTDKSTSEQHLLSLSAKSQSRVPERHSRLNVSEMKSENQECSPREKFLSEATGFSNQSYFRISELQRKHFDMAQVYQTQENKTEPESEWHRDTESEDSSAFKSQHTDSKIEAVNKLGARRKYTDTSRSDYLYVTSTRPFQKDFTRPGVEIQSSQSAKYKLSPSNLLDPPESREHLFGREKKLLASEQHNANDQNLGKFSSRDEANVPSENQSKETLVTGLNTAKEIYPIERVSVSQSIRPDMCDPLPLKLPQCNQSESEDYSDDTTDSPKLEGETWESGPGRTRSENLYVTEIGPPRMSYVSPHSSRLQWTESVEKNPMDLKRAYDNPTYGKALRSPDKKMLQTENVLERGPRKKVEDTNVPISQGSVFCIVGSPKSPTQSQVPETAEATESGTHALGSDDPVQLKKSPESKEINVISSSAQGKDSVMEQGVREPDSCLTQFDTDSTRVKLEDSPQREEKQAISSRQKIGDSLSSSISSDSHRRSERTDGFQKKEHTCLPSPTKSARYLKLCSKDSDDFQTVRAEDDVSCHSEDASEKLVYFEPECGRIRSPVPRFACDVHQNESQEASAVPSGSTNPSLAKSSCALSETKSSQSTESRSSVYYNPQSSPSRVKTPIQVRDGNSTPQQRFAASHKKIILPVIGSSILSTSHHSTQGRSASGQQLRLLSPFKSLHSPELASRVMSHPESGANLEDKLSNESATRTTDSTYYTPPPSASKTSTRFLFPSPEKSLDTTKRPFSTKSASKQQLKSVRVPLPETPLTLLRSSENPPERSHPSDERK